MMRSLFSGVAGLKTHQTKMDVIGNNIANVNTTSFKSQAITFSDLMYQTTQSATGASETVGGINARQIGLGSKSGAINASIETAGATETTNNPFDMRITGKAFFVVNNGTDTMYTRDGSFYVDGAGNLAMASTGYYVYGWEAIEDEDGTISVNTNNGIGKLQVMSAANMTYPPDATTAGVISGNIDENDKDVKSNEGKTVTMEFYDNLGYLYTAEFKVKDVYLEDDPATTTVDESTILKKHTYTFHLNDIKDSNGKSLTYTDDTGASHKIVDTYLLPDGTIDGSTDDTTYDYTTNGATPAVGFVSSLFQTLPADAAKVSDDGRTLTLSFTDDEDASSTDQTKIYTGDIKSPLPTELIRLDFNQLMQDVAVDGGVAGTNQLLLKNFKDIDLDFTTLTNVNTNGTATIEANKGDLKGFNTGRKVGTMNGITIGKDGKINATYTNGQTKLLGQIATAEFANPSGLQKEGDNLYTSTLNSGDPSIQDVTSDGGYITTGVLEMSNVDLSNEFTSMITTQRGFQANSRIITVSDTLLEELTNLKR